MKQEKQEKKISVFGIPHFSKGKLRHRNQRLVQGDGQVSAGVPLAGRQLAVTLQGYPRLCNTSCSSVPSPRWEGTAFQFHTGLPSRGSVSCGLRGTWAAPQALQLVGKEQVLGNSIASILGTQRSGSFLLGSPPHTALSLSLGVLFPALVSRF